MTDEVTNQAENSNSAGKQRRTPINSGSRKHKRTASFVLQGKGGVGKTLIASLIAQHIKESGQPVMCLDTDPIQDSFTQIKALSVEHVELLVDKRLNMGAMDGVISRLITEDANFVIDAGASSFVPLSSYLLRDNLISLLTEHKRVLLHTVIVGGRDMDDTMLALEDLINQFPPTVEKIVWINPFWGETNGVGRRFEESVSYSEHRDHIAALIRLPALDPHYSGAVLKRMLDVKKTFAEARADDSLDVISRWRLANIWEPIKAQLTEVVG